MKQDDKHIQSIAMFFQSLASKKRKKEMQKKKKKIVTINSKIVLLYPEYFSGLKMMQSLSPFLG